MELFYAAKKRAEDAGDAKALEWFNKVEAKKEESDDFHTLNGRNEGGSSTGTLADSETLLDSELLLQRP